jgi:nitrate/TMAO reductase-like tetraheme cytochrome c subunit
MGRLWRWLWAEGRKWRGIAAVGGVLFLVGSLVSVEATSRPEFCGTCHIMQPYYDSWVESAHRDVSCVKCHIEPNMQSYVHAKLNGLGQVVDDVLNRTGFKPSASVTELSCTRSGCHTTETLAGKTVDNGIFKFRHDKHFGLTHLGVEITCGTCHSHVMGDEHFEVNRSVCITCHMLEHDPETPRPGEDPTATSEAMFRLVVREGHTPQEAQSEAGDPVPPARCEACHEAPEGLIEYQGLTVDHDEFLEFGASCESCHRHATAEPPPIEDGRCVACHTFGVEESLPAVEMHRVHLLGKHKIECFSCHGLMQHGLTAQAMSLEQFDCRQCHVDQHSAQRDAYLLASYTDDARSPHEAPGGEAINPMFLAHVDCTGCHVEVEAATDNPMDRARIRVASAESCDRCHEPGMGERMIPLWQEATRKLYDEAARRLEAATTRGVAAEHEGLVEDARKLLELIRLDGSWGVHNPTYTESLLKRALGNLNTALGRSGGGGEVEIPGFEDERESGG